MAITPQHKGHAGELQCPDGEGRDWTSRQNGGGGNALLGSAARCARSVIVDRGDSRTSPIAPAWGE